MYLVSSLVVVWAATGAWCFMDHIPDLTSPETHHIHLLEDETYATFCHTRNGLNIERSTDSQFQLETKCERDEASERALFLLRVPTRCHHLSILAVTLQVNVSYIGQALQASLTGAWTSGTLVQADVAEGLSSGPKHTLPHNTAPHLLLILKSQGFNENWRMMWDGTAKRVVLMAPKLYLILSSGVGSKSSEPDIDGDDAQWWHLCVQRWDNSAGDHASNSLHKCQVTKPNGHEVVEVLARRHLMTVGHHTWLMKFGVDIQIGDKLQPLLNFTFHNTSQEERQHFILQFPVLQLILEAEVTTKRNQTNQHVDIAAEIRDLATEATIKFLSWELTNLHNVEAEDSYCDHNRDITGDTKCSNGECASEHCPYTPVSGTSTKSKPVSEDKVKDVRQMVISDVFNLESNMTVHVLPTGHHIIRIHQDAHSPFCPLLDWSLNQIFNFSKDFSGWEYVVSQWGWGNMVVRGEWGISPLQWYQKIFSFSLDQVAPLPSTHLILDFRNSSTFHVLVRWPTLASALTASVIIHHTHYTLQVKEIDEFKVENDKVLLEVTTKKTQAGLLFTWTHNAERITHLYNVATTLLTQATSHPWMCGDSQGHHHIRQFLENLLGKDLDHFHATITQKGWHVLHWLRQNLELDLLWEAVREELPASETQPLPSQGSEKLNQATVWMHVKKAAERLGLVTDNPEGEGMLVVTKHLLEWSWLAQRFWELLRIENNGKCPVSCQLSLIVEDLMSQLKHLILNKT